MCAPMRTSPISGARAVASRHAGLRDPARTRRATAHAMASPSLPPKEPATHRLLTAELDRAFGGDPGVRIFVQAALHEARRPTLPVEPEALLDFVRAHLLAVVTGELGAGGAARFLARLTAALEVGPAERPHSSHVRVRRAGVDPDATQRPPTTSRGPSRQRVALVHGDRFARVAIARQLLHMGCDVVVVDSFADLASIEGGFPRLAIAHMGARNVGVLLEGIVTLRREVGVVAIVPRDGHAAAEAQLVRSGVRRFETVGDHLLVELTRAVERLAERTRDVA